MATAIPPKAAEVASNRPVRQKFLCSGAGGTQPDAWSMGMGSVRNGVNLRKGTVTWEKLAKMEPAETYFLKARLWWCRAEIGAQKIQESVCEKFENAFFYEILYFPLEVFRKLLLI